MKAVIALFLAVASLINAATVPAGVGSHDLSLGDIDEGDWILWNREVTNKGSWWPWSTVESSFNFTVPELPSGSKITITALRATNKSPLGKGGFVKLVSGGINSDHVSLEFTSQEGKGIDFLITVYGKLPK